MYASTGCGQFSPRHLQATINTCSSGDSFSIVAQSAPELDGCYVNTSFTAPDGQVVYELSGGDGPTHILVASSTTLVSSPEAEVRVAEGDPYAIKLSVGHGRVLVCDWNEQWWGSHPSSYVTASSPRSRKFLILSKGYSAVCSTEFSHERFRFVRFPILSGRHPSKSSYEVVVCAMHFAAWCFSFLQKI